LFRSIGEERGGCSIYRIVLLLVFFLRGPLSSLVPTLVWFLQFLTIWYKYGQLFFGWGKRTNRGIRERTEKWMGLWFLGGLHWIAASRERMMDWILNLALLVMEQWLHVCSCWLLAVVSFWGVACREESEEGGRYIHWGLKESVWGKDGGKASSVQLMKGVNGGDDCLTKAWIGWGKLEENSLSDTVFGCVHRLCVHMPCRWRVWSGQEFIGYLAGSQVKVSLFER